MRRRRPTELLVAILGIGVALAACGTVDQGVTAVRARPGTSPTTPETSSPGTPDTSSPDTGGPDRSIPDDTTFDTQAPGSTVTVPPNQQVIDFGSTKKRRAYDGFLITTFSDIEQFWTTQYPQLYGSPFQPLKGGIFAAYRSRKEPIPGCGTQSTTYAEVEGNAFYCSEGDFIVYDDDLLMPELVKQLGQSSVGVVLSHEFGHAIQQRAGNFDQPTILKEQQADCFAGAWAAHLGRGESPGFTFGDDEIKQGLIAMIQVRDPVDGDVNDPNAHGSGFDRVGAFQDGFVGFAARCKSFFTEDRVKTLISIPFQPDDPNQGNLPVRDSTGNGDDIITLIPTDLDRFWVQKINGVDGVAFTPPPLTPYPAKGPYPACDGVADTSFTKNIFYCQSANAVLMDEDLAGELDADPLYGDLSVGYLIGDAYSESIQQALQKALKFNLAGKKRVLLNDCFTGAWVADDIPDPVTGEARGGGTLRLSAGDLDEVIITALARSDNSSDDNRRGTAFEKIEAFRAGVLGGVDACRARLAKG